MVNNGIAPFVKWAGGKRQLLPYIHELLPTEYNNYYEPFVGGGAVLFDLMPDSAFINDINKELINLYMQIKSNPNELIEIVQRLDEQLLELGKPFYYSTRDAFNNKIVNNESDTEQAALLLFLNKHCFNGLYRVNKKGLFNVPYNNGTRPSLEKNNILNISSYLQKVNITSGDFEIACNNCKRGDFVFFDSPYAPLNPTSFESYTKEGFDIESHKRLASLFKCLDDKGCYCMLTNHNTQFINELYDGYNKKVVSVKRMINSDASNRKGEEIIITNY